MLFWYFLFFSSITQKVETFKECKETSLLKIIFPALEVEVLS